MLTLRHQDLNSHVQEFRQPAEVRSLLQYGETENSPICPIRLDVPSNPTVCRVLTYLEFKFASLQNRYITSDSHGLA